MTVRAIALSLGLAAPLPTDAPQPHASWNEPAPAVAPVPPPPVPVSPPPPQADPDGGLLEGRARAGKGLAVTGFVLDGLGVVGLALVALPYFIAAHVARDRAMGDPVLVSSSELERRADNRMTVATTSTWVGLGVLGSGLIFTGVGLALWLPARRALRRRPEAQTRWQLGPMGLTARF